MKIIRREGIHTGLGHNSGDGRFQFTNLLANTAMQNIYAVALILFIIGVFSQAYAAFEPWNEMTLSVPRTNIAALAIKNYAIFAGGFDEDGSASDVVDVLEVTTRKLSQTKLSSARSNFLSASAGSYAVFAGGFIIVNETNVRVHSIDVLDVDSMQWKSTQYPSSFDRSRLVVTSRDNVFIFFNSTTFAFYDPTAPADAAWTVVKLTVTLLLPAAAIATDSAIFVARFNLNMVSFNATTAELIPTPITAPTGTSVGAITAKFVVDNMIYFATSNNVFIYSPQLNQWSGTLIPELGALGAVPLQGNIFAYKANALFSLNVESLNWDTQIVDLPVNQSSVSVVADKYVVIAGGFGANGQATAALYVYESSGQPSASPSISTPNKSAPESQVSSGTTQRAVTSASVVFAAIAIVLW